MSHLYRPLAIGDLVTVSWNSDHSPITGVLKKFPTVQSPYWEIHGHGQFKRGENCVCAFSGTVFISRLYSGEDVHT